MKQGIKLTNNHDKFRIELNNIDKSVINDIVSLLMNKYYIYLHNSLVKIDLHEDIFQDTFLKLTYNYDPNKNFVELFEYYFNMLKGWYYRSGSVINYHITELNENIDIANEEETEYLIVNYDFTELRDAVLSKAK